jgi:hypothetical protein
MLFNYSISSIFRELLNEILHRSKKIQGNSIISQNFKSDIIKGNLLIITTRSFDWIDTVSRRQYDENYIAACFPMLFQGMTPAGYVLIYIAPANSDIDPEKENFSWFVNNYYVSLNGKTRIDLNEEFDSIFKTLNAKITQMSDIKLSDIEVKLPKRYSECFNGKSDVGCLLFLKNNKEIESFKKLFKERKK